MKITPNYGLKKPSYEEFGDVEILNENADKIDAAIKVTKEAIDNLDLSQITKSITEVDQRVTHHLDDMAMHNQFMEGNIKKQMVFGINPILNCLTINIVEVTG